MKVLVWSEKHGDVIVAARDPEEEARAWLYLFKLMDEMGYYYDLDEDGAAAFDAAKKGGWKAANYLLEVRSGCEYETVRVKYITEP